MLWACITAFVLWPSPCWPVSFTAKYDGQIQSSVKRWWPDVPFWKLWKAQLVQESRLNPAAVSPVGARGLAQFMPGTWRDVAGDLGITAGPESDLAIEAGAYYMAKLRRVWRADRTALQRHDLAQASYNAGAGNILKAQKICRDARLWPDIAPCLETVTGAAFSRETRTYVARIGAYWKQLEVQ